MNADTEFDPLFLRPVGVALDHAVLNLDRATRSVDGAGELDQDAIAGPLDDAAAVLREFGPGIRDEER